MSAICGIVDFSGARINPGDLSAMISAAPHRSPDGIERWTGDGAALVHMAFHVTPESVRERQPLKSRGGRFVLAADARIDNREELLCALRDEPFLPSEPTDADIILAAYQRWREHCPERLLGDFVFAVWDTPSRSLFLARDPLGGRSLCYCYDDGRRCIFASEVDQILDIPGWKIRINEGKVGDYLADLTHEQEETYFESVLYCPPAHCLTFSESGIHKRRYWDIDPAARVRYRDDREYADHFLELLTDSTRCRMRSIGPIGLSLSGGLDSTLLAALATRLLARSNLPKRRLKTFSYVFDELRSCDERDYIGPVAERYDLDAAYLPCDDKWALKDLEHWPIERDSIGSDAYSWLVVTVAQAARDAGCRVLLSGQYGDVLFLGGHYWAAEMIKEGRWRELVGLWQAHGADVDWRRDLLRFGVGQLLPAGIRRALRRLRARRAWGNPALPPEFAKRTQLPDRARNSSHAKRYKGLGQLGRLAALSENAWPQGFCEARKLYCRFGLESESPYYDRRLVELVMALPADQLGRAWRGRWLQRNAMQGLLPESVVERPFKTDFELLTRKGLFEREVHATRSILSDARCVELGFVRANWLKETLARTDTLSQETLYYFWRIIALELWLRRISC